jgi:hypothetical protein
MLLTIILVSLAFIWLLHETKCLTIRLPYGKEHKPIVDDYTAYYTGLLDRIEKEYQHNTRHIIKFTPMELPEFKGTLNIPCKIQ